MPIKPYAALRAQPLIGHRMTRLFIFSITFFALALPGFSLAREPLPTHADAKKVLRVAMPSAETSFDPQYESDSVTNNMMELIFEPLLTYDYLARPAKLIANTAADLPQVSADGREFTIRIQPGIWFADDLAFAGKPRELIADDYVFAFKRLLDPKVRSNWFFLVDGKLQGGDAARAQAKKTGQFDYDQVIPGIAALDRYTLKIRLVEPDFSFPMQLTLTATGAIAREVVQRYGAEIGAHPVGTGPYLLAEWRRSSKVVLHANPRYRARHWEAAPPTTELGQRVYDAMRGKRIPQIGRIEVSIIPEAQPRWLAFLNGELDYIMDVPEEYASFAMPGGKLSARLAERGFHIAPYEVAWLTNAIFNMRDSVIGGFDPPRIALRRAMAIGYRIQDEITVFHKGQAVKAETPLLPSLFGFREVVSPIQYDPARAQALLDLYGYVDRDGDGYREQPDGTPLLIDYASEPTLRARQINEIWKRSMDAIGIRLVFRTVAPLPELRKKAKAGQIQMWTYGWIADYPDGENIFQLLTTKSIGTVNYANFSLPEFDALYERSRALPYGPERAAIYDRMVRMVIAYAPWRVNTYRRPTVMLHPWVKGYSKHPFMHQPWHMMDIDRR
jgi:oligopeptide transport system substrate-binding protein